MIPVPITFFSGAAVVVPPYDNLPGADAAALAIVLEPARLMLTSWSGSLCRLRRGSDNAEMDFGPAADGTLDTAAILTWLGGATGYLVSIYDQTGNGLTYTQSSAAAQAVFSASVADINARPGFLQPTTGGMYGAVPVSARPFTAYAQWCSTSATGSRYAWAFTGSNPGYNQFVNIASGAVLRARSGSIGDATSGTFVGLSVPGIVEARELSATSRACRVNGGAEGTNTTSVTPGFTGTASFGNLVGGGSNGIAGYCMGLTMFSADITTAGRNVVGNAASWYGTAYVDV